MSNSGKFDWFKRQVVKMFNDVLGMIATPGKQWQSIANHCPESASQAILYSVLLAIIPSAAWYWGTTQIGWQVGDGDIIKLTAGSAYGIIPLFYFAMVGSIVFIGYMVHWMAQTYGADSSIGKGIAITGFAATPLFLAGVVGFYPIMWLALILGVAAVCHAVYLLYLGIPIVMSIPEERGFLFASAVVGVCMVILMVIMGGSVILWDMGFGPEFTD